MNLSLIHSKHLKKKKKQLDPPWKKEADCNRKQHQLNHTSDSSSWILGFDSLGLNTQDTWRHKRLKASTEKCHFLKRTPNKTCKPELGEV